MLLIVLLRSGGYCGFKLVLSSFDMLEGIYYNFPHYLVFLIVLLLVALVLKSGCYCGFEFVLVC